MITISAEAILNAMIARVRNDDGPNPVALRNELGLSTLEGVTSKGSSFFHARRLGALATPDARNKFVTPFVTYREGSILVRDRIVQIPTFRLFIYDDPVRGYSRINRLIPLVSRALTEPKLQVAVGAVIATCYISAVSGATSDPGINMLTRYMTLAMDTTW